MERQLEKALRKIEQEVRDGVRHGNFKMSVSVTTVQSGTRRVLIEAGKSHKYEIPVQELDGA